MQRDSADETTLPYRYFLFEWFHFVDLTDTQFWDIRCSVEFKAGEPLTYRIVDDYPLVYSVGVDGDDDAGQLPVNKRGETKPEYAAPKFFGRHHEAVHVSECDGDWILWPTAVRPWDRAKLHGERWA